MSMRFAGLVDRRRAGCYQPPADEAPNHRAFSGIASRTVSSTANHAARPLSCRRGGPLKGAVRAPGDKSISHRALILGALAAA